MISILIPIYNFNVTALVQKLVDQCSKAKIHFEIICFDDGSSPKFKALNQPILNLMGVNYVELSENYGRSKIRNKLAKVAQYDYLLFLDCDSKIKYANFIKNYIKEIKREADVTYGGRYYKKGKPRAKSKVLHWKYGSIRDLVFARVLEYNEIEVRHIHNPTEHIDLIKTDHFLAKAETATENLKNLIKQGKIKETKLSKTAVRLENFRLKKLFLKWFKNNTDKIMSNLRSDNPNLRYLDAYKLFLFFAED